MDEDRNEELETSSNSSSDKLSGVIRIIQWFMKLPITLKQAVLYGLAYFLALVAVIILIIAVQSMATVLADELSGFLKQVWDSSPIGQLVSIIGDVINPDYEKKAREAQDAFYAKLEETAKDFKEWYSVEIDISLLTATLFYEKNIGDYVIGDIPEGSGDNISDLEQYAKDEYEFYKHAKNMIYTLARFQVVETTTYNNCSYEPQVSFSPESSKDVANGWSDIKFNSRDIYNDINFSVIPHTNLNGEQSNIVWCPYHDAESQLSGAYNKDAEDLSNVKTALDNCENNVLTNYESCTAKAEEDYNSCVADKEYYTNSGDCATDCLDYFIERNYEEYALCLDRCDYPCQKAVCPKGTCDVEKNAYDIANKKFENLWITDTDTGINNGPYDRDGNFQCVSSKNFGELSKYGKTCSSLEATSKKVYSLDIAREGVYYFKLMSRSTGTTFGCCNKSFIETYYSSELKDLNSDEKEARILEIVDGIYEMYEAVTERNTYAYSNSNMCPTGVTLSDGKTFGLEDYVAMVVSGEANSTNDEALKAHIIAARTYTLARTRGCTIPVPETIEELTSTPSDHLKQLVLETTGKILTYNGEAFLSQYDNFFGTCNANMCTGVYTKLPNGETHTVSVPESFVVEGGAAHGNGMSLSVANYLASQGNNYEEILSYFYSPDVKILISAGSYDSSVGKGVTLSSSGIIAALAAAGHTLESYSNEMFTVVRNAGLGTRLAVLSVANYASSNFYNITGGNKLNYTFGGDVSSYGFTSPFGVDCSGFVSWVLYNAGFVYKNQPAYMWGDEGNPSSVSAKKGVPGDLIVWESYDRVNRNDHVAIIVNVDEGGYYTAEAYSPSEGIVNDYRPFNLDSGGRNVYVVDMSSFYEKNKKTDNYPGGEG